MKKTIEKLEEERKELQSRITKIDNAIKAFRAVCTHQNEKGKDCMEWEGNDSHKDHYKCTICGETTSV